jgi:signal transduction histidine kinase
MGRIQTLQVDLHRDYDRSLQLFSFAGELRQLFANLIGNALDAMTPEGGRLVVRSHAATLNGVRGIRISVADTGCGITQDARRHIFEPFFTTKEATGTGLGLWVSEQIIRKHHGSVRVRSRVTGRTGTVFSIFFPAAGVDAETASPELVNKSLSA